MAFQLYLIVPPCLLHISLPIQVINPYLCRRIIFDIIRQNGLSYAFFLCLALSIHLIRLISKVKSSVDEWSEYPSRSGYLDCLQIWRCSQPAEDDYKPPDIDTNDLTLYSPPKGDTGLPLRTSSAEGPASTNQYHACTESVLVPNQLPIILSS